ncbi:MAG: PhnD/SsuA/transferrin family substrate-binding protein [Planctomycetota bacterium]|nr:PhnD/SsuA/transferrin family substrate-binding protein [Planctomycetota bacterium]
MTAQPSILLGAVAYDPKVVAIWEGIRDYFNGAGVPFDFVLFSNYERQVQALLDQHIDVAWNTPLAHVRIKHHTGGQSLSLGMRDSDRDFHSRLIATADSGIAQPTDLHGKRLAVGSRDSTQARILPLYFLKQAGVVLNQVTVVPFDTDVGKHGDTGTSELDVLNALRDGTADAGTVGDLVWVAEQVAGHVDNRIQSVWTTPGFDHCMFDALPDFDPQTAERFKEALFAMKWDNPEHRRLLELEGLREWLPPREQGYDSLRAAIQDQDYPI